MGRTVALLALVALVLVAEAHRAPPKGPVTGWLWVAAEHPWRTALAVALLGWALAAGRAPRPPGGGVR